MVDGCHGLRLPVRDDERQDQQRDQERRQELHRGAASRRLIDNDVGADRSAGSCARLQLA